MQLRGNDQHSVLIYDRDIDWARAAAQVLEQHDYHVDVVGGEFNQCQEFCCHKVYAVLVVNMDSLPEKGKDLVRFMRDFPQTNPILVQDEHKPWDDRIWEKEDMTRPQTFGAKTERLVVDLARTVERIMKDRGLAKDAMQLEWPENIADIFARLARNSPRMSKDKYDRESGVRVLLDEARMIISRMFAPRQGREQIANKVVVECFSGEGGRSSSEVFKLTPVVLLDPSHAKSALLKFGPIEEVRQESLSYDKFVEWFVNRDHTVRKIAYAEAGIFAGLLYSFPRDDESGFCSFARYVQSKPVEKCLAVLDELFSLENKRWLAVKGNDFLPVDDTRFQSYYFQQVLHCTPHELRKHFQLLEQQVENLERKSGENVWSPGDGGISIPKLDLKVPDPVDFMVNPPCVDVLDMTVVHGDMHSHNLLLDDQVEPPSYYFIDFKYTGFGHIYRDFLELELAVRYDLFFSSALPPGQCLVAEEKGQVNWHGLKQLARLEDALLKAGLFKKAPQDPLFQEDSDQYDPLLDKAFQIIKRIRELAEQNCPGSMRHYYMGLIPCSLRGLKYDFPLDVRIYRVLVAGLYARHLRNNKR